MPYCTIEEAWNQSLNLELSKFQDDNKKKDYNVEYKNSKIYDESGKSVTNDKKCKQNRKVLNLSRTYNRLPEHSGPKTRLNNYNNKNDNYYNNLENNDLPINEYNNSNKNNSVKINKKNKNIKNKNKNITKNIRESFNEENDIEIKLNNNKNNNKAEIDELKNENKKLKEIINELKNNTNNTKDSFLDVLIFIITGIIIILMMENITKLVRKF
jgi:hypothetical protein